VKRRPVTIEDGPRAILSLGPGGMRLEFPEDERFGPPGSPAYPVVRGGEGLVRLTGVPRG